MISGGRAGYDRLQVLARVRWPDTAELFERVGVGPGMHCLDLGCGGGDVTLELARLVGPEGRVTGIDMDEVKLELAREVAAERGLENVQFRVDDVTTWSAELKYDLVYCRFLLEHLVDPRDLLRRMWAGVERGGSLAVEDADFQGQICEPPNDGYELWRTMYMELLRRRGGDPEIGRKLHGYFLEVGAPSPQLRLAQDVSTDGENKTLPLLTLAATADALQAEGLVTERDLQTAIASLTNLADDATTLVAGPWIFQVWARRT
ncbi:MAG TPA: class I SAM-dependent methyltransferase [Gaiellaceae bacterium]|nr:class I SAM-dependent methyltransferase [Gaiellaceae bacterium]